MSLLPKGVIEISPHLYLGPESAVKHVILKHKCRHILRAMDENTDSYSRILEEERTKREPWLRRPQKPSGKGEAADLEDDDHDDDETRRKQEELDAVTGASESDMKKREPFKVEELVENEKVVETTGAASSSTTTTTVGGAGGVKDSQEATVACHKCGVPVIGDEGSGGDPKHLEEKQVQISKEEKDFQWLSVPVVSHFCPMEDDLKFDITRTIPKAVDWLGQTLSRLGGDGDIPHYDRGDGAQMTETDGGEGEDGAEEGEDGRGDPETINHQQQPQPRTALGPDEPLDMSHAVYIHCYAGVSRSPTVLLAYLMARKEMPLQNAVDEYLPPTCRPNPSFIQQLMMLEEMFFGDPSNFDVQQYNLDGLVEMFADLSRRDCEEVLVDKCGGNVIEARNRLMKMQLQALNKERMMVQALMTAAGGRVTEEEAEKAWKDNNKNRDAALFALMKLQEEKTKARQEAAAHAAESNGPDGDPSGI